MQYVEFARCYEDLPPRMEESWQRFTRAMESLWQEGDSLTLIHADMMDGHVLAHGGRPYLIDWGQARYGSFYLDLPNLFNQEQALVYRDALAQLGHEVSVTDFLDSYHEAARYPGLKYIGFWLHMWKPGQREESVRGPLLDMLLHGK
ncbi:MAG: aminoglycoside phosphotransferase family protein [Chloroflexota bacterium]|nr:aminoglycoside phosphotransferase family protein [Chloroflexota bacterium]